ncbi:MAG: sulfur transferase domain-containing protein [Pseudomonadota bacterium]
MGLHRYLLLLWLIAAFQGAALASAGDKSAAEDAAEVRQFAVTPQVTLAGLPSRAQLQALSAAGTVIIDLRDAAERTSDQPRLAGLDITHFPSGRTVQSSKQLAAFSELMTAAGQRPVYIYCASGNRAGLVWASHLIAQGYSVEAALAEVSEAVTSKPIKTAIRKAAEEQQP